MHGRPHLSLLPSALLAAALLAAGCSSGEDLGSVVPAPEASAAACADALSHAPASVLGHPRTKLDVAGAAAWGAPDVVLRCGLPEPGPTSTGCLAVDDVDWVLDDGGDGADDGDGVRFTTFGRVPAVEVRVSRDVPQTDASAALVDLRPVAVALPATGHHCS